MVIKTEEIEYIGSLKELWGKNISYDNMSFVIASRRVANRHNGNCDFYLSNGLPEKGPYVSLMIPKEKELNIIIKHIDPEKKWPVYATKGKKDEAVKILNEIRNELESETPGKFVRTIYWGQWKRR